MPKYQYVSSKTYEKFITYQNISKKILINNYDQLSPKFHCTSMRNFQNFHYQNYINCESIISFQKVSLNDQQCQEVKKSHSDYTIFSST